MSVQLALRLCGFLPGERFSVAAIRDREIRADCFDSADQAEAFLAQYAGWNHYICGNPVRPECRGKPRAEDVVALRVMLVDADPGADGANTSEAINRISKHLGTTVTKHFIDSGRGSQLWLQTTCAADRRRPLLRYLAKVGAMPDVKFDATHNPERLMRLPGSVNLKTGRVARWVVGSEGTPFTDADYDRLGICDETPVVSSDLPGFSNALPTKNDLEFLTNTPAARAAWDSPVEKGERSKRDFDLVLAVLRAGGTEQAACRLLYAMPGSKAAEDGRGQDYWESTLASARRHLEADERRLELARSLPDRAKADAGAPFEPEALDALLAARSGEEAGWARLRAALKAAKVPIRALEQAMERRAREGQEADPALLRFVGDEARRVGWFKRDRDGGWVSVDGSEARATMRAQGQDPDEQTKALTDAPWRLVNEPFAADELPGRLWNKDGARLALKPEDGPCATWLSVLQHVGRSLDEIVLRDPWCVQNGVRTGADYLLKWVAAMIQRPKNRSAYLFLHGPQEAGKSTLHEALRDLFLRGYARANHALKSKEGFNGEIANAVLCVVEEIDLSDPRRDTHERIKDWVTGETISVRAMYRQAVDYVNTTHWIHCAQKRSFMPVLPGDTRITEVYVDRHESPMAKDELRARLRAEAPMFLGLALREALPQQVGRLFVPALGTLGKEEQADAAMTELEIWMRDKPWLELTEEAMVDAFLGGLPPGGRALWDRARVLRELPPTARRDRRLAGALRGALGGGALPVSGLLRALGPRGLADWGNAIQLGRAVRRIAACVPWLRMKTLQGLDVWYVEEGLSGTPVQGQHRG